MAVSKNKVLGDLEFRNVSKKRPDYDTFAPLHTEKEQFFISHNSSSIHRLQRDYFQVIVRCNEYD